jgi:5'-methylthioadenosine phosphorylase
MYFAFIVSLLGGYRPKIIKNSPCPRGCMMGIIGGSGIYSVGELRREIVSTQYGEVEAYFGDKAARGKRGGCGEGEGAPGGRGAAAEGIMFVPRHGAKHEVPPHKVNYKANLWALKEAGVSGILSFYAAGIISDYSPGELVLLEDFLGFGVHASYYDKFGGKGELMHADMGEPYNRELSSLVEKAALSAGVSLARGGIIATTLGPRFETRAEVSALKGMGANLVNMTSAYEASLAGELGIPLCGIAVGTNYACGVSGKNKLTHTEVLECMEKANGKIQAVIGKLACNPDDS